MGYGREINLKIEKEMVEMGYDHPINSTDILDAITKLKNQNRNLNDQLISCKILIGKICELISKTVEMPNK